MNRTTGNPEITVGLIDGPVATDLPEFASARFRHFSGSIAVACGLGTSAACRHGTYVAGILAAQRGSGAPGICPGCTFVVRAVFAESVEKGRVPLVTARELVAAVQDVLATNTRVVNLSVALVESITRYDRELTESLNAAARREVLIIAAAGNQATLRSTALTRHPWVIPVAACDQLGRLSDESNFGGSIGRGGLRAPGIGIVSLAPDGTRVTLRGTSVATPFVTGAVALLLSLFPRATGTDVRRAVLESAVGTRRSLMPRLLDTAAAYNQLERLRS